MYCDTQTLEDRITGSILDAFIPEQGEMRERVLSGYCKRASAKIDAVLSSQYATPLTDSALLADIAANFALMQIAVDRGNFYDKLPAGLKMAYDESVQMMNDLASGKMKIGEAAAADGASAGLQVQSPATRIAPDSPGMEWF